MRGMKCEWQKLKTSERRSVHRTPSLLKESSEKINDLDAVGITKTRGVQTNYYRRNTLHIITDGFFPGFISYRLRTSFTTDRINSKLKIFI